MKILPLIRVLFPPILLLMGLGWIAVHLTPSSRRDTPRALSGTLDLSHWNFLKVGGVRLDGEWLFVWNQFLKPEDAAREWTRLEREALRIQVPGFFVDAKRVDGQSAGLPNQGYGSFLLRIKGSSGKVLPGLSRSRLHSSSRILVFNADDPDQTFSVIDQGNPAEYAEGSTPYIQTMPPTHVTVDTSKDFFILIHMSNFHFSKGGISPAPILNELHREINDAMAERTLSTTIMGIILALAFYNMTFFMRNRRDRASLHLSIFCLLIVWRSFCPLFFDDPGQFHLDIQYKSYYSTMVLPLIFITSFLRENFPAHLARRHLQVLISACLAYGLWVLATPTGVFSRTAWVGQIILLSGCSLIAVAAMRAAWARELGGVFSLIGCICLVGGTTLDVLIARGILSGAMVFTQYGLTIFLFMQSQIVGIRFASAFRTAELLGRQLRDEVDRQTRDLKSILKSIRQGIFSIKAANFRSDDQTSSYLEELLGRTDVQDRTIDELLLNQSQLSDDEKSQVREAIAACLNEDALSFEFNEGNLVRELRVTVPEDAQDRILEVDWAPILDKSQRIEKLLVSIRDVTEIRGLEREAQQKDQDLRMLLEVLNVPEDRFKRFIKQARNFIEENRLLLQGAQAMNPELLKRLFVNMHTLKGGARGYQLKTLSDASHQLEQSYVELRQGLAAWDRTRLLVEIDSLAAVLQSYLTLAADKLGWDLGQRDIRMSKTVVEDAIHHLDHIHSQHLDGGELSALNSARSLLIEQCSVRISDIVEELRPGLDSISRDLGKQLPLIRIEEGETWLTEKAGDVLHSCLLHLFRNALDHGLEKTEARVAAGKDARGTIDIRVDRNAELMIVSFADDGRGLNLDRIARLGAERGLLTHAEPSPQDLAELILQPGFSTKDEVSEISGRGVGMDAIRTYLQDQGGSLVIELLDLARPEQVPFVLKMILPVSYCMDVSLKAVG